MRGSRQVGEEEFVDDARTRDPNGTLLFARRMRCHNHAAAHALGPSRYLRAVVEAAYHLTFWTLLDLIRGEVQTRLDERMIEYRVLFAAGHIGEAGQVGENSPGAILSVEAEQGARLWELMRREVATNGREALTQFLSITTVASVAKRAEPTFSCGPD